MIFLIVTGYTMEVVERMPHVQRSATADCRDECHASPTGSPPEIRRSISMETGEAEGVRKLVPGFSGSIKRRSIRVSIAVVITYVDYLVHKTRHVCIV